MAKPSKEILAFMEKHSIDSDEIWEVHGNSWCIKHKALERAGATKDVSFIHEICDGIATDVTLELIGEARNLVFT